MDIRILPSNIANLIAAGEVVQRPASVVKELMENAVDAGATQISVFITDAGRTSIQVIDNGCGMNPDDAVLCFERHATSKIATAEDLTEIMTFGFRGEALASIAAVAEVTLKTKAQDAEVGCTVQFADSRHISTEESAVPAGANFMVRNLFYNVPARRKFLKSDNVEMKHIIEEFTRVALTCPDIAFTLNSNGRDVYVLKRAKSLKYRIQDLMGSAAVDKVVDIAVETSVVSVSGYICRPDLARKTLGSQFFFVNGRFFKSPYLHKAVMKAYENLIPEGTTPSYFIWLQTRPDMVDVNISPTKTEIKFEDESVVFQILYSCVRESLGRNSFAASIDFSEGPVQDMPVFSKNYSDLRPDIGHPDTGFDFSYDPFAKTPGDDSPAEGEASHQPVEMPEYQAVPKHYGTASYIDTKDDYGRLFDDRTMPSATVLVVKGKYIVSQVEAGLRVVSVRRAWERIYYERFLKAFSKDAHVTQVQMFPVQVTVGAAGRLVFDEHSALLASMGFDIAPFGDDTVVVNGMPEGFPSDQSNVEAVLADLLIALDENFNLVQGMVESAKAERFAKVAASRCGGVESTAAAQRLIDTLFKCSNPEYTIRGQRIMTIVPIEDIDKKF